MKEAALDYLTRGFSVVPAYTVNESVCTCGRPDCDRPGKHSRIRWAEYQKRRPTVAEVEAWWSSWPDANIAIITGAVSGLVVIDLDGPEAEQAAVQLELPATLICTTGRGRHLYYAHPGGYVPNKVRLLPGLDVRADGGYVMAPPSLHASGRRYTWGAQRAIARLPDTMVSRLRPAQVAQSASEGQKETGVPDSEWALRLLGGVPEGGAGGLPGRNEAATKLAGHFLRHLSPKETYQLLVLWNQRNKPPLGDEELRRTIISIANREGPKRSTRTEIVRRPLEVISIDSLMLLDEEVSWLVEGVWIRQSVGWIAGPPKTGKTWFSLDLAMSVASGLPFLGQFRVGGRGPVLIVLEEDTAPQLRARLGKIAEAKGLAGYLEHLNLGDEDFTMEFEAPKHLPVHLMIHQGFVFSPDNLAQLEAHVAQIKPALIILDPFYRMSRGFDEFKASETMEGCLGPLADMRYRHKCGVLIVHHTTKNTKAVRGGERMYGSMAFHAWSESAMHLTPGKNGVVRMEREFKSAAPGPRLDIALGDLSVGWYPVVVEAGDEEMVDESELVIETIQAHGGSVTRQQIEEALGMNTRAVQRKLREMIEEGALEVQGSGTSTRYRSARVQTEIEF